MIKIVKTTDIVTVKNIIVTLYGQPGIGKTTLGFTAKNPLLFDFDNGVQRAGMRGEYVYISNWNDIKDLSDEDLINYDTIIIDTVGRMLEILAIHLIKENPKLGRATGELTLQGYGALASAFKAWLNKIKSYNKDIVLIGHAKESSANDINIVRVDAAGSSKDEIFKCSDLLGYIEAQSTGTYINFNPTEKSLGKNCAQLELIKVENVKNNNHILADIIQQTKDKMNKLSESQIIRQNNFEVIKEMLENVSAPDHLMNIIELDFVKNDVEFKTLIHEKSKKLGFNYNKDKKCYESKVLEK